jgi:hypothetical protein
MKIKTIDEEFNIPDEFVPKKKSFRSRNHQKEIILTKNIQFKQISPEKIPVDYEYMNIKEKEKKEVKKIIKKKSNTIKNKKQEVSKINEKKMNEKNEILKSKII